MEDLEVRVVEAMPVQLEITAITIRVILEVDKWVKWAFILPIRQPLTSNGTIETTLRQDQLLLIQLVLTPGCSPNCSRHHGLFSNNDMTLVHLKIDHLQLLLLPLIIFNLEIRY